MFQANPNLELCVKPLRPGVGPVVVAAADDHGVRRVAVVDRQSGARVIDPGWQFNW